MKLKITGFAERLKEVGYTTAFAGKWDAGACTYFSAADDLKGRVRQSACRLLASTFSEEEKTRHFTPVLV